MRRTSKDGRDERVRDVQERKRNRDCSQEWASRGGQNMGKYNVERTSVGITWVDGQCEQFRHGGAVFGRRGHVCGRYRFHRPRKVTTRTARDGAILYELCAASNRRGVRVGVGIVAFVCAFHGRRRCYARRVRRARNGALHGTLRCARADFVKSKQREATRRRHSRSQDLPQSQTQIVLHRPRSHQKASRKQPRDCRAHGKEYCNARNEPGGGRIRLLSRSPSPRQIHDCIPRK